MIKVIIAGSREFDNYDLLAKKVDFFLQNKINKTKLYSNIEIVSGTAKGADTLGEKYAKERGFALKQFPADWELYGKRAGYVRNKQMRDYADICIVFWDGKSRGSKHMIDLAKETNMPVRVVLY